MTIYNEVCRYLESHETVWRRSGVELDSVELTKEFVRLLTEDSETTDRRRKDFNLAVFDSESGAAVWSTTDLAMILDKFDHALENVARRKQ